MGSRAVRWGLGLVGLVLAGTLAAQEPGWDDVGAGAGTARPPAPGLGTPAADSIDALGQGRPGADESLEEWLERWAPELRGDAQAQAGPLEGSERLFGGLFGEPSWTASRNQRVVLKVLGELRGAPAGSAKAELRERILDALAERAASDRSPRDGGRRAPARGAAREAMAQALARPGTDLRAAFAAAGVTVWDFKAGAWVLLDSVAKARAAADQALLAALLDDPPDPAGGVDTPALLKAIEAKAGEAAGRQERAEVDRLGGTLTRARTLAGRQERALATLRGRLGDRAMTSPGMLSATLRRDLAGMEAPVRREVEAALLELARTEAELGAIGAGLDLPSPGTVSTAADGEVFAAFDPSELGSKLRRDLLDADLNLSVKLLDLDVVPGVNLSARYRYELEGRVKDSTWTRVDQWRLRAAVGIGDLLADVLDTPLSIALDHEREIVLVRVFDSPGAAAAAIPKTPLAIPFTLAKAREMPVGWFWSLPVRLSAAASLALGYSEGLIQAGGYTNYLIQGRFRMNFFKESPSRIRVQLVGAHEHGPGAGVHLKLGVEVFGIRILDRALDRLLDLRLLNWDYARRRGVGIAADYAYDLQSPEAGAAFEKAVRSSLTHGRLLVVDPRLRAADVRERLLVDLRPTEKLFLEDREKPEAERRIDRRFLGTNTFRVRENTIKIGSRLARWGSNRRWAENELAVVARDGTTTRYDFPIFNRWTGWSLLFGVRQETSEIQAFSLMAIPAGAREPAGPQGLVLAGTYRDRSASRGEIEDLREAMRRSLGPGLSGALGLDQAAVPDGGKSLTAMVHLALHPEAMAKLLDPAQTSEAAVRAAAERTAAAFEEPDAAAELAEGFGLVRAIPGGPAGPAQTKALVRLADTATWRNLGSRFLAELLPAVAPELVHVQVGWQGKGATPFAAQYGEPRLAELQQIVSEALSAISDRERP